MIEEIIINVEKSTRMVSLTKTSIGNDLENLQQKLVFKFTDNFVDGSPRLEYKIGNNKYQIPMTKEGQSYTIPIKNVLTREGKVEMQLVVVQTEQDEEIPVFKSNVFYMYCNKSINAQTEAPDTYEYWLDVIQTKLAEIDEALEEVDSATEGANNLNLDVSDKVDGDVTVTLTKKDASTKTVTLSDGTSLMFNWNGTSLGIKTEDEEEYTYVDLQGRQGPVGPKGEAFTIKKTYSSVAEMNADFNNMNVGDYVMIASSVEIEDNAKLYTRGENAWIFISDFSGATGIRGETGLTPNIQIGTVTSGVSPSVTRTGTNENPVLNFVLEKGEKGNTGNTGPQGEPGNGISTIQKTSTSGLVDTYTITFTDGTTTTFNITNGEDGEVTQTQLDETNKDLDYYKTIYNVLPKVKGNGTDITLDNTSDTVLKLGLSGNTEQDSTTGKNLLEPNFQTREKSGITVSITDKGWKVNGTSTAANYSDFDIFLKDLPAGTYTINTVDGAWSNTYQLAVYKNSEVLKYVNDRDFTFTLEESATIRIRLFIYKAYGTFNNFILPYQLEQGSEATTPYEPYTGGISAPNPEFPEIIHTISGDNEITICGKNLLNRATCAEDKILTWVAGVELAETNSLTSDFIKAKSGDSFSSNYTMVVFFYKQDKTYIGFLSNNRITTSGIGSPLKTFTIPSDDNVYYMRVVYGQGYNDNANMKSVNIMLNKGTTLATYEPHKEQVYPINLGNLELCKIGDYKDYIYEDNSKWYLHKEIGKVVLDGTETWKSATNYQNVFYVTNFETNYLTSNNIPKCNYFKGNNNIGGAGGTSTAANNSIMFLNSYSPDGRIYLHSSNFENLSALTTWITTNNVSLYYALATPTTTEITDTTLITQLNNIKYALAYKDQTNISQTNNELPFIIDAETLRDMGGEE